MNPAPIPVSRDCRPSVVRIPLLRSCWMVLACWTVLAPPAQAGALEDHDRIRRVAAEHARDVARSLAPADARVNATAGRLDPRLRLAACPARPEPFSPPGHRPGANLSVGVRCPVGNGWSLYIPVRIEILSEVLVLAAPRSRGELLTAEHVRVETRDVAQLSGGYLTRVEDAEQQMLRRPIAPGTILTRHLLEPQKLVLRGQRVRVTAGSGRFQVTSEGEALADAAAGERVRVRNLRSRQVIEGTVEGEGHVRLGS